jgi:hypothetical protein
MLRKLRTYFGRVIRDVVRKIDGNNGFEVAFAQLLLLARRVPRETASRASSPTIAIAVTTHSYKFRILISEQKQDVTPPIKRELRSRSAVERVFGHFKAENRMARNYL